MSSTAPSFSGHVVSVTPVKQAYTNWCWAACCEMFAKYYGFTRYDQRQFVLLVLKGHPPATDPRNSTSLYNSAAGPKDFLPVLQHGLPTAKSIEYVSVSGSAPARFSETAMKKFLDENRIMMYGSGSHAKILVGYGTRGSEAVFMAIDPEAGGPIPVPFTDFSTCAWVVYRPKT